MPTIGIATRLGALLAAFAVLAAGVAAYQAYTTSRELLLARAEQDMLAASRVLSRNLRLALNQVERDVRLLGTLPASSRALAPDPHARGNPAQQVEMLQEAFEALLATRPGYTQVRLIAADANRQEVVRVDRSGQGSIRVVGEDLQEKGHYPYVYETLRHRAGEVYLSTIALNREEGVHGAEGRPTLRVATPVAAPDGSTAGLVVINVDMGATFEQLRGELPPSMRIYVANRRGDYLIHPDPNQVFGFDVGRRHLVQADFTEAASIVDGKSDGVIAHGQDDSGGGQALVAAFSRMALGDASDGQFLLVGLAQEQARITESTARFAQDAWHMVLVFGVVAAVLGLLVARRATRSVKAMAEAAQAYSLGKTMTALPIERADEIGQLARSLHHMQHRIEAQVTELRDSEEAAQHLALHDVLTGLPNRRLFLELLEAAVANARRGHHIFALLFIDLDGFKAINDRHGHAAGDAVLRAVAGVLRISVREIDTVARLAGDEFAVICGGFDDPGHAEAIARKLIAALDHPLDVDGMVISPKASIGIALFPRHGETGDTLLARADQAMYEAKAAGRDTWRMVTDTPAKAGA